MPNWLDRLLFRGNQNPAFQPENAATGQTASDTAETNAATGDEAITGLDAATLAGMVQWQAESSSNLFADTVERIKYVIEQVNQNLPEIDQGGPVPELELLYSTDFLNVLADYQGPIAILIPEVHCEDPYSLIRHEDLGGLTAHAIKASNTRLNEYLYADQDLNIKEGLCESFYDRHGEGKPPENVIADTNGDAVEAQESLLRGNGGQLLPAEKPDLIVEQRLSALIKKYFEQGLNGLNPSSVISVREIFHELDRRVEADERDPAEIIKAALDSLLARTEATGMVDFNGSQQTITMNFNYLNSDSRSAVDFENIFFDAYHETTNLRNPGMVEAFCSRNGICPIVIGADHVAPLEKLLEEAGVPVITIGVAVYRHD